MSLARTPLVSLLLACAFLLAATSCTSTRPTHRPPVPSDTLAERPAPLPAEPPAPTPPPSPPAKPKPLVAHPAAASVVARLATQLLVAPESISVVSVAQADWPDACLGLPADGEICAMMITPGYAVTLAAGFDSYAFRTDASGEQIRIASAPAPKTGDPLVTWRDSSSFNMMVIGTQRVATGRRGRPLIAGPLAVPARATELQGFLARFAPFQAQTPAGEVALRGVGPARATEADQRMIAEWARLVSLEARHGAEQPGADAALTWMRSGGIAGLCDAIVVTRTGDAIATSCRSGEAVPIARIHLPADELATLYHWLDRYEAFSAKSGDPETAADATTTALEFRGSGIDEAPDAERAAILAWIDALAVRLREAALR